MSKKVMTSLLNCGLETDSKFPLLKTRQLLGLFFLSNNDQSVPDTSAWAAAFCPDLLEMIALELSRENKHPTPDHSRKPPPTPKENPRNTSSLCD